jgi:hypothetical protein
LGHPYIWREEGKTINKMLEYSLPPGYRRQGAELDLLDRDRRVTERRNLPFDEWTEIFGSERLTGALLDRVTHHVHILEMNGDSYRLKQSRRKRNPPADR